MKNLNGQRFGYVIFFLFALIVSFFWLTSENEISTVLDVLKIAYKAIPIIIVISTFFIKYAWRWKIFKNWLVPFPDLNGTWEGHLQTTWKNPETGEIPGPIPSILTIYQTFTKISCVMRTGEMKSFSYLADFWLDEEQQIKNLGYCYRSVPNSTVQHRSSQHDGTIMFEMKGDPINELVGNYWTARKTTGEAIFIFSQRKKLDKMPEKLGKHPFSKQF